MPNGLLWQSQFASDHGKPISFPEWGTGTNSSHTGGGDDPYFVEQMSNWIRQHNVVYQIYWDEKAGYDAIISDGEHPAAGAAYKKEFYRHPIPSAPHITIGSGSGT